MTMTREELKGKQTPGEVSTYQSVEWNEDTGGTIVLNANSWSAFAHIYQHCVGKKYITEGRANAALYAEAHNVANRTGMWPEDLVDRVKELEEAMGDPGFWGRAAARNGQKAAELERRVKELEEALRPFTHPDLCETLGGNVQGDESPLWARNRAMLKLGHFKTASATLNKPTP